MRERCNPGQSETDYQAANATDCPKSPPLRINIADHCGTISGRCPFVERTILLSVRRDSFGGCI
jgi:hypothetical protein